MSTWTALRTATGINTVLIAAAASAAFVAAYDLTASDSPATTTAAASSSAVPAESSAVFVPAGPFTDADTGDCLNWDVAADGKVSNFQKVECSQEHRFEVATREDLAVYPTSEFGKKASIPSLERQAQLREELCQGATLQYVDGKFDPAGKFSIAPILPPAAVWEAGDRTMLCGLQTTDQNGVPQVTKGKVVDVDQANIAETGQCRAIDKDNVLRSIPCADPHQLETVAVVDLKEKFPQDFPRIEDQDAFLSARCAKAAEDYLGGEENLYQSTLQPYWGTVAETSWAGGTHSVNCSLIHVSPATGSFSTITGSAKNGKAALMIDGAPPTAQPPRNPLRPAGAPAAPAAADPAAAATAAAAAVPVQ